MRFLLLTLWLIGGAYSLESNGSNYLIEGLTPGTPPPAETVEQTARAIGKRLRCPVCQGLSIADSNAEGAIMIQRRVEELVAAGYDKGQIEDYFIDKYGEWILLEPPPEGLNLLIWVAPGTALTLGMFGVLATYRRPREALTFETKAPTETDSYEAKLLEELDNDF